MKKKKVTAVIEASSTGFGIFSDDLPGITGYGKSIDEAKVDIASTVHDVVESYKEDEISAPKWLNEGDLEFEYHYDLESLFKHFAIFDVSALAKRIGINPSLMRQYKAGLTTSISRKQKEKIEKGLHELGQSLLDVRL